MRRDWQIMALLAAATIAVFWQVSRHEFVNFDDPAYVTYNPVVREGLTWPGITWAFTNLHGEATYWHPVTWLSHMLDCQLFGLKAAGHHLTSLFLHTLNTLLLFVLLRRMTGRRGPSAMVAALFALHPLQVDSVAWIAERKNVLSACFFTLTLWAYARYAKGRGAKAEGNPKPETRGPKPDARGSWSLFHLPSSVFYLLSLFCFALGLMSKPTLVPLPFLLLLLDYWPLRRLSFPILQHSTSPSLHHSGGSLRPLLVEKIPFLVLTAVSCLVTLRGHESLGALASVEELPIGLRLANAAVACALYLRKLVWPMDLSVFYLHPGRWPAGAVAASALLVLGVTALAVWQVRRRPYLIVGWLWFLGMLVPVIGLVQAHVQAMADRFAYVPVIGVFIMAVWAAAEWMAHLAATIPANHRWTQIDTDKNCPEGGSARTRISSGPKQSEPRPKSDPQNPCSSVSICGSPLLRYGLAVVVLAGCVVMTSLQLRYWRNSITLLQHAVRVEPANFVARLMLGNAMFERRQLEGAAREYQAALRLRPDYPEAWLRAGVALTEQGRPAEAMPYLTKAGELAPGWAEPQRRLALALLRQGRLKEAHEAYQKLVPLMPATAEGRRDLADMLAEGQQYAEALHCYCEALRLKPDFDAALNNLAMLRASCQQPEFRNGQEAVQLAEAACRLSGRRNPSYLGTLAAAYAEAGRFGDAVKTIQKALALAKASGADALVPIQTQMLQQFRAGKPYRQALATPPPGSGGDLGLRDRDQAAHRLHLSCRA
jgi:tetratricopeptide (TPR) repeat protein